MTSPTPPGPPVAPGNPPDRDSPGTGASRLGVPRVTWSPLWSPATPPGAWRSLLPPGCPFVTWSPSFSHPPWMFKCPQGHLDPPTSPKSPHFPPGVPPCHLRSPRCHLDSLSVPPLPSPIVTWGFPVPNVTDDAEEAPAQPPQIPPKRPETSLLLPPTLFWCHVPVSPPKSLRLLPGRAQGDSEGLGDILVAPDRGGPDPLVAAQWPRAIGGIARVPKMSVAPGHSVPKCPRVR